MGKRGTICWILSVLLCWALLVILHLFPWQLSCESSPLKLGPESAIFVNCSTLQICFYGAALFKNNYSSNIHISVTETKHQIPKIISENDLKRYYVPRVTFSFQILWVWIFLELLFVRVILRNFYTLLE